MRTTTRVLAVSVAAALTLAACASKPGTSGGSATPKPSINFLACMVSDRGGIDDRSFNASAYQGILDAQAQLGVQSKFLASHTDSDYAPNINTLVADTCGIIVTVGYLMGDATKAAAKAHPDEKLAIVDQPSDPAVANMKGLQFNTAQAAFLAGYTAAAMTKTGKVATYGGLPIPPVTVFMDGFWEGVQYFNLKKSASVQVLGWNENKPKAGTFAGSFDDQSKGQQLARSFIQQGADIIFPVAGPVGLGSAKEAQDSKKALIIWVDTDGFVSAPQYADVILTSVVKGIDAAVLAAVKDAVDGTFNNTQYIGTLANGGTSLAPFHNFDSTVPAELKTELDQIKADIISGAITITSPNQPK